jgi:hypothetical protein
VLNHEEFWMQIKGVRSGIVWLCVWRSWKQIADESGFDGIDLAAGLFGGVFERATVSAKFRGAVSVNTYAAYWANMIPGGEADEAIERLRPIQLRFAGQIASLELFTSSIEISGNSSSASAFSEATSAVEKILALPDGQHLPYRLTRPRE